MNVDYILKKKMKQFSKLLLFWVHSHLRFIRCELLCDLFSPCSYKKMGTQPIVELSVHAIVDQIASVNVPT